MKRSLPVWKSLLRKLALRVVEWGEAEREAKLVDGIKQGSHCHVRKPLYIKNPQNIVLGDEVMINASVTILAYASVTIGSFTMVAPNVSIITSGHDIIKSGRAFKKSKNAEPITVGANCWLGAGVILLPGVEIGEGTVVGAGSVVTKSLPSWSIAVGTPARVIRAREQGPPDPVADQEL
ncbi:MAG: DapH/DapD/GlmU-related protein [Chthoniobacterales bacterium]